MPKTATSNDARGEPRAPHPSLYILFLRLQIPMAQIRSRICHVRSLQVGQIFSSGMSFVVKHGSVPYTGHRRYPRHSSTSHLGTLCPFVTVENEFFRYSRKSPSLTLGPQSLNHSYKASNKGVDALSVCHRDHDTAKSSGRGRRLGMCSLLELGGPALFLGPGIRMGTSVVLELLEVGVDLRNNKISTFAQQPQSL